MAARIMTPWRYPVNVALWRGAARVRALSRWVSASPAMASVRVRPAIGQPKRNGSYTLQLVW